MSDNESLSWGDMADRQHLCPASPDYDEPHIVGDGETNCRECGATVKETLTMTVMMEVEITADLTAWVGEYHLADTGEAETDAREYLPTVLAEAVDGIRKDMPYKFRIKERRVL